MAATYQVVLERDERGWWVASVPAVPGAHTQGRSIAQVMNRIRDALSLWVTGAEQADLVPTVHLPASVRATVRRATAARERAQRAEEEASGVLRDSIQELTRQESLSTRDVAELLELSPSRVDQLKRARAKSATSETRSPQRARSTAARRVAAKTATRIKRGAAMRRR
jgi:predicted RNase H-like HicB family nuclease